MSVESTNRNNWTMVPYQEKRLQPQHNSDKVSDVVKDCLKLEATEGPINSSIIEKDHQLDQLKRIVEPSVKKLMSEMTEKIVTSLMESVPDFDLILQKATRADGKISYTLLQKELENLQREQKKVDKELYEWELIEPIAEGQESELLRSKTVVVEGAEPSIDAFIADLNLIQELFGDQSELEELKAADYIIVDGQKLDYKAALSMLYRTMEVAGTGVYLTTRGTYLMCSKILRLSCFLGISLVAIKSPWLASLIILSKLTFRVISGVISFII
ncbi:MAG: hypothetical protein VX777_01405 [Chlamydiota bacterium]|nr:hypothetical protein [Chlamydiota bacterium]